MSTQKTSESGYDVTPLSDTERDHHAARLTAEQRRVLLAQGTEAPFCGNLLDNHRHGLYACALCGLPLFSSRDKFDSGTGWPSFFRPFDLAHIHALRDLSHGMERIEARCARCEGHLGHVFPDGPPPTNTRYCLNSESLEFFDQGDIPPQRVAGS